jgi:hypothetical protein
MLRKLGVTGVLLLAGLTISCGTASRGPDGSLHQSQTGVSETGYPGGKPVDAESPALASSSEQKYARAESSSSEPVGEITPPPAK